MTKFLEEKIALLQGGYHSFWDIKEKRMVKTFKVYIPWGCPDWGEENGQRNNLCTFCSIPNAVLNYRQIFYDGKKIPIQDHVELFDMVLRSIDADTHTLKIFNGGSFLSMPNDLQRNIFSIVGEYSFKRIIIESRSALINESSIHQLLYVINTTQHLLIRIGVETQDNELRNKILKNRLICLF